MSEAQWRRRRSWCALEQPHADEQPPRDERRACNQQRPGRTDSAAQALQGELDPFPRLRIVTQRVASTRRDATRRDEVWLLGLRAAAAARHAPERRARTRNSAIPTRQPHPYRGSVAVAVVVRHDAAQHDDAALSDGCAPFRGPEALHQLLGFRAAHGALDDSGLRLCHDGSGSSDVCVPEADPRGPAATPAATAFLSPGTQLASSRARCSR